MAIYSIFIFKFYRFLARKDIITLNLDKYSKGFVGHAKNFFRVIFYMVKHIVVLPLIVFFWFAILSVILLLLSKTQSIETILMIAIGVVGAVRITAYYNEDLSKDLAKMIPFALLGVFLINVGFFSVESFIEKINMIPGLWQIISYYLAFIVFLEIVLRILDAFVHLFKKRKPENK